MSTQVTEAHRKLVAAIIRDLSIDDGAQLIADSEAKEMALHRHIATQLAAERARLDWLLQDDVTRFDVSYHDRAAIDTAMKEGAK